MTKNNKLTTSEIQRYSPLYIRGWLDGMAAIANGSKMSEIGYDESRTIDLMSTVEISLGFEFDDTAHERIETVDDLAREIKNAFRNQIS